MLPWDPLPMPHAAAGITPLYVATAYAGVAVLLVGWAAWSRSTKADAMPTHSG